MSAEITIRAFLGDGERSFALTDPMIAELERLTDTGIGAIYRRATAMQFHGSDLAHIIRLALIGGGTSPQEAAQLVATWVENRPYGETYPLALDVLDARWNGVTPATADTQTAEEASE